MPIFRVLACNPSNADAKLRELTLLLGASSGSYRLLEAAEVSDVLKLDERFINEVAVQRFMQTAITQGIPMFLFTLDFNDK